MVHRVRRFAGPEGPVMRSHGQAAIPRALTVREVASRLGCSPATVLRLYRAGHLWAFNLGLNGRRSLRFDAAQVETFIRRGGVCGATARGHAQVDRAIAQVRLRKGADGG